jgi:hypothetical protein
MGVDPAAVGRRLFVMLPRRQSGQRIGQIGFFLFLGHPAPQSQSLQVHRLIGLYSPHSVAGAIFSVRRVHPQL